VIDIRKSSFNPLSLQVEGWHQNATDRVNKGLAEKIAEKHCGAIYICLDIHKDNAQICPFEEHPCCNRTGFQGK